MKKVTKPASKEEAVYYSDFNGESFGNFFPDVQLTLEFNYGSIYDGSKIQLDLSDEEAQTIIHFLRDRVSEDFKTHLKKQLDVCSKDFDDSMQMRDWDSCDRISNNTQLFKTFLQIEE